MIFALAHYSQPAYRIELLSSVEVSAVDRETAETGNCGVALLERLRPYEEAPYYIWTLVDAEMLDDDPDTDDLQRAKELVLNRNREARADLLDGLPILEENQS